MSEDHAKSLPPAQAINELMKKPFLNEQEVSALTGRAVATLRNDRHMRRGFPYLKVGKRSVRYKLKDVVDTMESNRIAFCER